MNYGAEPADQVVRYSLEGTEVALRLSGRAAVTFAKFVAAVLQDQKKTHGKTRLVRLLREGKPLKFFSVEKERMREFAHEAKMHGLLFVPMRDKTDPDHIEIAILADDASKVNRMRDPESIAVKQYGIYKQAAGKTAKSILVSVGVRLAAFNLPQIARLTMTDELHLDDLGERRVALFCCIPDSDKSLNYLVGMVYTQLIQTLFYQADRVHRGRLPVPVHCLMDEFPNISLPKDSFQSALATMRSRGIFCSIIVQNIAQLKSMYKDSWESLVGLCDEFLYLGGNEQGTHKYVSELIGKETVETTSRSLSRGRSGSSSTSHQQTARDLMTPDEVRLLSNDKALLFVRGERPVMDWKYNLLRHPNIRFTEDGGAPPYDYTVAPDAHEDLAGNAENYELLDMDDFLPAAEQPKPMFTYPRRNAHASQQD